MRRSVPPVSITVNRSRAASSSVAMVSPLVTTVTPSRSVRWTSARATAVVVVPTSSTTVWPDCTSSAARRPIAAFSAAWAVAVSS